VINSAETITTLILVALSDATPAPCWIRAPRRELQVSRSGPSSPFLTLHPRAQLYDGSADPPDPLVSPRTDRTISVSCRTPRATETCRRDPAT